MTEPKKESPKKTRSQTSQKSKPAHNKQEKPQQEVKKQEETSVSTETVETTKKEKRPPRPKKRKERSAPEKDSSEVAAKTAENDTTENDTPEKKINEILFNQELCDTSVGFAEWKWLTEDIRHSLKDMGFVMPTEVQAATIEPALAGHDLVIQAKTGSGKTAAFIIPLVENIAPNHKNPKALIMVPTRELAKQACDVALEVGKHKKLNALGLYGGIKIQEQIREINKGVDIVVGSPGRLLDLIRKKLLDVSEVEFIVLDEADEMLSQGFYEDVTTLLDYCKNKKQLMLFSATIPDQIESLVKNYLDNPYRLMIQGEDRKVDGIQHVLYSYDFKIPGPRNLLYVLECEQPETAIVFCNQRNTCDSVASYLVQQGKNARPIHGEMDQKEREQIIDDLKAGKIQYLIATDLAARGIDINELSHVINYDFPPSAEIYIHRAGRTGRNKKKGICINLFTGSSISTLAQLKQEKIVFELKKLPPVYDIIQKAASTHIEKIYQEATLTLVEDFLPLTEVMTTDPRGKYIFSYLLKLYHQGVLQEQSPNNP